MSIRILKQGLYDTVQDNGRYGYQHLGINPGGTMDNVSAAVSNILVGNRFSEAVIEMHFPAAALFFEKAAIIAISGAGFGARINNQPMPLNTMVVIGAASTLSFDRYISGARVYLAVQGGFSLEPWLDSYSTNTKAGAGGFYGRVLKKDDIIHCRAEQLKFEYLPPASVIKTPVLAAPFSYNARQNTIYCTRADGFELLAQASQSIFTGSIFTVSRNSDRMAYHLTGKTLQQSKSREIISAAVTRGAIQLFSGGQLAVLMADHQTTGGYPVIAYVISAHICLLAQMQPGAAIQFEFVKGITAEQAYMEQQQYLVQLQEQCNLQLKQFFS